MLGGGRDRCSEGGATDARRGTRSLERDAAACRRHVRGPGCAPGWPHCPRSRAGTSDAHNMSNVIRPGGDPSLRPATRTGPGPAHGPDRRFRAVPSPPFAPPDPHGRATVDSAIMRLRCCRGCFKKRYGRKSQQWIGGPPGPRPARIPAPIGSIRVSTPQALTSVHPFLFFSSPRLPPCPTTAPRPISRTPKTRTRTHAESSAGRPILRTQAHFVRWRGPGRVSKGALSDRRGARSRPDSGSRVTHVRARQAGVPHRANRRARASSESIARAQRAH
jgi:hypothetical protein